MGKLIAVLLGTAVVAGVAYYAVKGNLPVGADGKSAPKQTLDNMRAKAKDIEQDTQQRADDLMKRTTPE